HLVNKLLIIRKDLCIMKAERWYPLRLCISSNLAGRVRTMPRKYDVLDSARSVDWNRRTVKRSLRNKRLCNKGLRIAPRVVRDFLGSTTHNRPHIKEQINARTH